MHCNAKERYSLGMDCTLFLLIKQYHEGSVWYSESVVLYCADQPRFIMTRSNRVIICSAILMFGLCLSRILVVMRAFQQETLPMQYKIVFV